MFQFDSDFYKQCHSDRVAELRTAYERRGRSRQEPAGRAMRRYLRRSWARLRYASLRHAPAFRVHP